MADAIRLRRYYGVRPAAAPPIKPPPVPEQKPEAVLTPVYNPARKTIELPTDHPENYEFMFTPLAPV